MRVTGRPLSARARTFGLTGVLAGVALYLCVHSAIVTGTSRIQPDAVVLFVVLAAVFYLAEQYLVSVEFRSESHSMTFAGVPLALGVILLPGYGLVLARALGSATAFARQRPSAEKAAYNIAAYAFEGAAASTVAHGLLGSHIRLETASAAVLLAVLAAGDQVMSLLVLLVIRWHAGRMPRADVLEVLASSVVLSVVTTAIGATAAILLQHGWFGGVLVTLLVAVAILVYRAHSATARRHESLALVHDFVVNSVGAESLADLAERSLDRMREMVRAGSAELLVRPLDSSSADDGTLARIVVEEGGVAHPAGQRTVGDDWVLAKALEHGVATLLPSTTKDSGYLDWLRREGIGDAMVSPLCAGNELLGAVLVTDRLGETLTFTADDLTLLQTLAGHLGIALRSRHVVDRLRYEATHDSLTGLANRAFLSERLREAAAAGQQDIVLMLLDLNKFKEVNDVLGHDIGDRLLCVVADRLRAALSEECVIARLGGDEFAVMAPGPCAGLTGFADRLAVDVRARLGAPVRFGEALLVPTASVGFATTETVPVAKLLRCADTAMYVAKGTGTAVAGYDVEMDRGRAERLALLADLRVALDEHPEQFVAYYQPKFHLATRTLVGAEALVRWLHPERGTISPDLFIPLAETSGLIERLTEHILRQALEECAAWHRAGYDLTVAVNLSPRTVRDARLPEHIDGLLAGLGLPPDRLILEITEGSVMADPERAVPILHELVERGIVLSLDDFGTGYSSLSYLQQLPVHELKIDRSFVARLNGDDAPEARTLVRSITALGRNLGLRVVAEGIETEDQYAELLELGCHVGQGFLVSRPVPAAELRALLDRARSAQAGPVGLAAPGAHATRLITDSA